MLSYLTGNEALDPNTDVNDETLAYVIDAVYTLAEALHRIHSETCGSSYVGVCEAMDILSGDQLFSEVASKTFQSKNEDGLSIDISFSGEGTVPFHIFNIQQSGPVEVSQGNEKKIVTDCVCSTLILSYLFPNATRQYNRKKSGKFKIISLTIQPSRIFVKPSMQVLCPLG